MDFIQETLAAEKRIRQYIRRTPLEFSSYLSDEGNCKVYLKMENVQITNSFKIRGALNKLIFESKEKGNSEFVTASSGNHGTAFAYALKELQLQGTIYLPHNASKAKVKALQNYESNIQFYGNDCVIAEKHAREMADKSNLVYVSPYNDEKIIAGQATIALELLEQLEEITTVLVPIGGGGLVSGIAGYLKNINPEIEVIGCLPANSPVMYNSVLEGKIVEIESKETLSDGTAGGIEPGSITFGFCKAFVDTYVVVSEAEIKEAILFAIKEHNQLIEGAAALGIAAFMKKRDNFLNKLVVIILSGGRIGLESLRQILL